MVHSMITVIEARKKVECTSRVAFMRLFSLAIDVKQVVETYIIVGDW